VTTALEHCTPAGKCANRGVAHGLVPKSFFDSRLDRGKIFPRGTREITPGLNFASNLRSLNLIFLRLGPLFSAARCLKLAVVSASLLIFSSVSGLDVWAQQGYSSPAADANLPEAPQPTPQADSSNPNPPQQASDATITGTVLDQNRDVLQGASVTLTGQSGTTRTMNSGSNGQFSFSGLPADEYKLTVTAPGMSTFTSTAIPVRAGEAVIAPAVTLSVSSVKTSVTVSESAEQLSEQQEQIAVQQRIGGVIPNFYSTYDWNAPPMLAKQKFQLSIRSTIDPVALLSVAGVAGAEQYKNIFPAYGSGFEGYSKRYGAALANHATGILLGRAVYPAIFHQDPRYFYKGKGSIGSRALYAVSASVIARGDDGRWKPNYSRVLGNFSAAAISNLYYPRADRGASLVLLNGLAGTGADAVANLIREFLLKRITSHVPQGANGEP
jgi:Carboxypeptidase regulatory-like domain